MEFSKRTNTKSKTVKVKHQFFGHPESPLFGCIHPARRPQRSARAVVICPPIGQEYIQSHWNLRLLANQLTRKNIDVLRFDYHGIGDSAGELEHINSLDFWTRNIHEAIEFFQNETSVDQVMLVGLRFGCTLAAEVAKTSSSVHSAIFWEPVFDGRPYLNRLRQMHESMIDLWFTKIETPNNSQIEEILGTSYSRALLNEIENSIVSPATLDLPQLIVDLKNSEAEYFHNEPSLQRIVTVDDSESWYDLAQMETAWLRANTTRTIVNSADDMFERLQRFGVLSTNLKSEG